MGFFNPELAQQSLGALTMMDFEGIDDVKDFVQQGQTLLNLVQQLTVMVAQLTGQPADGQIEPAAGGGSAGGTGGGMGRKVVDAGARNMTGYQQRLAQRSGPNMDVRSNAATPGA